MAQERRPPGVPGDGSLPLFDGQKFLEQFFGGPAHDNEVLDRIEISVTEEQEYGQRVWRSFEEEFQRQKIKVLTRGREVTYLQKLVGTLQPQMSHHRRYRSIRVLLADTPTTDAYSIPGGTLVIFRGMLELTDSEAALTGVLGHELSHLDRGHQLVPLKRMKLARQGASALDPASMMRQANVLMSGFMRPFRPEDEAEADRDGVTWAYRAGYDPRAMGVLFTRLGKQDQIGKFAPAFLRSHPLHAERLAAMQQRFDELQAAEPRAQLYLGRTNVRRLIPMSEQRFDE